MLFAANAFLRIGKILSLLLTYTTQFLVLLNVVVMVFMRLVHVDFRPISADAVGVKFAVNFASVLIIADFGAVA